MVCDFEGCGREIHALGLCATHYKQQYRGQELTPIAEHAGRKPARVRKCIYCQKPVLSRGLCPKHYYRDRKGLPMKG